MIIRPAREADLSDMVGLTRDALSFASSPDSADWESLPDKELHSRLRGYLGAAHSAKGTALVVEVDARIVGFVACRFDGDAHSVHRAAFVEVLAVAPEQRNRGLGTHLVQELMRALPTLGIARLDVDVVGTNDAALRFWRRAGFRDIAVRMTSDLGTPPDSSILPDIATST